MGTYRYLILKAKLFPEDKVIEQSTKKLKDSKEVLQHNIICYNNFLIQTLGKTKLLITPNDAIKISKEEENNLLKDEDL